MSFSITIDGSSIGDLALRGERFTSSKILEMESELRPRINAEVVFTGLSNAIAMLKHSRDAAFWRINCANHFRSSCEGHLLFLPALFRPFPADR